ncbi:AAA family ATPase [Candidatus Pacearchaeota archaeon]|nr:AAA family ATPase [Candidatus Pacearchaeota archaeon]
MGKTIGVVSLKGGVGKTSTVVALGAAIADLGKSVLLVDGNLSAPNLGLHLNIIDPEKTLHHVLMGKSHAREAVYNIGNVDVIPASIFNNNQINPLKLRDKIKFLKKKYDFTLIDSSPALNEETLATMLASDSIFVVSTPDHPTLSTTIKAMKLAKQRGTPIDGLILNKVHNKNFELSVDDIENTTGIPVMAVIPHDINILKALSEFTPSTTHKPNSEASKEYRRLAATLVGRKYQYPSLKRFFRWINPKKQDINRMIFYKSVFG